MLRSFAQSAQTHSAPFLSRNRTLRVTFLYTLAEKPSRCLHKFVILSGLFAVGILFGEFVAMGVLSDTDNSDNKAIPCEDVPDWRSTGRIPFSLVDDSFMKCCLWDGIYKEDLFTGGSFIPFAFLSAVLLYYLIYRKNDLRLKETTSPESYDVLFYFLWASLARTLIPPLLALSPVKFSCPTKGFIESFVTIFEIECLAHLCIDRYVRARYITKGWELNKNHKLLYLLLCTGFATLYSILPYYGIVGSYTYDFDCVTCTLDMMLPEDALMKWSLVCLYFLKSVKPVIAAFLAIFWARKLEKRYTKEMIDRSGYFDRYFTKVVRLIACVNILFGWTMWFFVRSTVIQQQLISGQVTALPYQFLDLALILYAATPILTNIIIIGATINYIGGEYTFSAICNNLCIMPNPTMRSEDVPANKAPNNSDTKEKEAIDSQPQGKKDEKDE